MANLYADTNFYITEVNYGDYGGNNAYDIAWAYTGNNTTANFTVRADNDISNVNATGKVLKYDPDGYDTMVFPAGNAFTTTSVSQTNTSNSGSGLTIQVVVDSSGTETINITANGSGYYITDSVTFPSAPLHRVNDLRIFVFEDDREGITYFPSGLTDADVVANAVPLMNVEYGF